MPYQPDTESDGSHGEFFGQPESSSQAVGGASNPSSSNFGGKREEPKGIARYFHPQPKPAYSQSPAVSHTGTPVLGSAWATAGATAPATPTLVRTPSRIAVIINSSQQRRSSQQSSRNPSEESAADMVTSDINPPRRARPSTTLPSTTSPQKPPSTTTTPRRGRPPATVPRVAAVASGPTTQTPATQPTKRRGRPLGWRPGMGSYAGKDSFPGGPSVPRPKDRTGPPKKRGRPPGRPGGRPPRAIWESLRPHYVPFLCEWDGCPAELHNVDTLRRHVRVVHGREGADPSGSVSCRWGKCNNGLPPKTFSTGAEFERHMEDAHLVPFVWHVGDGPRNAMVDYKAVANRTPEEAADELPGYLFDAEGNQVTPSVLHQEFENEEERKERVRRLRRVLAERDRNAPEEEPMSDHGDGVGDVM